MSSQLALDQLPAQRLKFVPGIVAYFVIGVFNNWNLLNPKGFKTIVSELHAFEKLTMAKCPGLLENGSLAVQSTFILQGDNDVG